MLVKSNDSCFIVIECEELDNPANGAVTLSGVTVDSTATYSCIDGYTLEGVEQRVCQQDGQWSDVAPTCRCELLACGMQCIHISCSQRDTGLNFKY